MTERRSPSSAKRNTAGEGRRAKVMLRRGFLIALAVLIADQATKFYIVHTMMNPPQSIEVTGFFNLVMVWNRGVSFGLGGGGGLPPWSLALFSVVVAGLLTIWLRKAETLWTARGLGLVIGGAIGNAIDRLAYGAVADFLDFHVAGWHWPAFNVADAGITVGVALLLLDGLFDGDKKRK